MSVQTLTAKDFVSDQEVKWCPGCGDYSILKQMQSILPEIGVAKEDIVFISGIGCSSRFPYYLNTYGMHGIHGRAPAIATGVKLANPDLSLWVITGDGDGLSIGGNHLIHALRRNIDLNILLFNNEIYGLTKGQYSPTSEIGLKTKSSPLGNYDSPFNPISLALGSNGGFIARTIDRDPLHLREMLKRSQLHKGTSFLEIYQNCPIFNDAVFEEFTDKTKKPETTIYVENKKPLTFGKENQLGIRLDGLKAVVVDLSNQEFGLDDLWIHEENNIEKALILSRFSHDNNLPRPFGVVYESKKETYDNLFTNQLEEAMKSEKDIELDEILSGKNYWVVD